MIVNVTLRIDTETNTFTVNDVKDIEYCLPTLLDWLRVGRKQLDMCDNCDYCKVSGTCNANRLYEFDDSDITRYLDSTF